MSVCAMWAITWQPRCFLCPYCHLCSVFERYYRELLNFLAHKVRDRDVASDLTQESFARVYAAERTGTPVQNPRAFLYRTARNVLIDLYRRDDTASEVMDPRTDAQLLEGQAAPAQLQPEEVWASRQRFERLAQVVDQLPPRCRETFILVKFDGLSHAETAQRMGVSIKTVEMQVQIALKACGACLDEGQQPAQVLPGKREPRRQNH